MQIFRTCEIVFKRSFARKEMGCSVSGERMGRRQGLHRTSALQAASASSLRAASESCARPGPSLL